MKWTVSKAMLSAVNNMKALGFAVDYICTDRDDKGDVSGIRYINYLVPAPAQLRTDENPYIGEKRVELGGGDGAETVYSRVVLTVEFKNGEPEGALYLECASSLDAFSDGQYSCNMITTYTATEYGYTVMAWLDECMGDLLLSIWNTCLQCTIGQSALHDIARGILSERRRADEAASLKALCDSFADVMTSYYGGSQEVMIAEGAE